MKSAFEKRRERIGLLTVALTGLFGLAAVRIVGLVVFDGPRLDSLARSEHTERLELGAVRGPIVDANGEPLALSALTQSVYARPRLLAASMTRQARARLAAALGLREAQLGERLRTRSPFVFLARHVESAHARAALALGLSGIGAVNEYKRFYPEGNLAAGVVGMAGMDGQGLSGMELQYDRLIRGAPVALDLDHDALGRLIVDNPLDLRQPVPGDRIELTIDDRIQALAESALADEIQKSNAAGGSVIAVDPFSGAIRALANLNARSDPVHSRLHDAAIQDAYEPGSTMKALLVSIALADGAIGAGEKIYCENGRYVVGRRTIHDDGRHEWLDLGGIIEVSSNIGAAKIALRLGAERYYRGLRAFGIGEPTGIDLPGAAAGLLRPPGTWREIDLATHGFGQGIAVTPLQLAMAYAAIANGGLLMRPYVVRAIYDASGRPVLIRSPQIRRRVVTPEVAHQVAMLLRGVVEGSDGTGRLARVDGFAVAGKTGTAQMVNPVTRSYFQNRLVASFIGFLPASDPRLLILVVLRNVGHGHFGGLVAAPVFSTVASGAIRALGIVAPQETPSYETASFVPFDGLKSLFSSKADANTDEATPAAATAAAPGVTPDFRGLSLRRALLLARSRALVVKVRGSGFVRAQEPPAGASARDSLVSLTLGAPPAVKGSDARRTERRLASNRAAVGRRRLLQ